MEGPGPRVPWLRCACLFQVNQWIDLVFQEKPLVNNLFCKQLSTRHFTVKNKYLNSKYSIVKINGDLPLRFYIRPKFVLEISFPMTSLKKVYFSFAQILIWVVIVYTWFFSSDFKPEFNILSGTTDIMGRDTLSYHVSWSYN